MINCESLSWVDKQLQVAIKHYTKLKVQLQVTATN